MYNFATIKGSKDNLGFRAAVIRMPKLGIRARVQISTSSDNVYLDISIKGVTRLDLV